jgi:pheromone shutdown-related protein TraB
MDHTAASEAQEEPIVTIEHGDIKITILGTAHVSKASADKVNQLVATGDYDAVAVELCPSRHNALIKPDSISKMNLFEVIREGKAPMVAASLALGAYQQRLAEQFDIKPGAEMRAAIDSAREGDLPVLLIDRDIGTTLKRIYRNVPWWKRFSLIGGLLASVVTREKVSEDEIEKLKEGDMLETAFSQFADEEKDLYKPLIDERDRYMAARLEDAVTSGRHKHILAVVGAGHMKGMEKYLRQGQAPTQKVIDDLDQLPPPSVVPKLIPWIIVLLVLIGFGIGFYRSPELGWQLVGDWVLINGGLSALGALIAGAHVLTVITAFIAAPLTSLNPTIGAGMVTAAMETIIRKPQVQDFSHLRKDTTHLKGWWQNRVTRILLIFLLSTLGSAVGTYVAGFKIFGQLTGGT